MPLTKGIAWIRSHWIPPAEVRAEIWALGTRHRGRVIEGARIEGGASGVSFRRAILLKAVIRKHRQSVAGRAELAKARS